MTFKEFLEGPIKQQNKIIGKKFKYHAFALDAMSIEFIGKIARCKDKTQFRKRGNEKEDFLNAIGNYFPFEYKEHKNTLYSDLQCGMAHFFGPNSKILLAAKSGKKSEKNLDISQAGKLLLIFEDFHEDLCSAIDQLISEKSSLLNENFLNTREKFKK